MATIREENLHTQNVRVRRATERGHANYDWLDTWHTFSFNTYYDPAHMGFRSLRVMNEDRIAPGKGFAMHGHRDMEIITYVLEGALEHRDSLGTGSVLRPGEFQRMTAGTGIRHSEFNPSPTEPVHLYQIWLLPNAKGLPPSYEQKAFAEHGRRGRLQLVASPDRSGRIAPDPPGRPSLPFDTRRRLRRFAIRCSRVTMRWLQVLRGSVALNGLAVGTSDGVAVSGENHVAIRAAVPSEVLLFDLA